MKFIFVGNISDSYLENYKKLIDSKRITIVSGVNNKDLPDYYNAADIACWPKHASLSSIEAASCGLPIIVTKTVKERVKNGNGIAIKDENINEIARVLTKLSQDKKLRLRMGQMVENILKEISYDYLSKQFIDL